MENPCILYRGLYKLLYSSIKTWVSPVMPISSFVLHRVLNSVRLFFSMIISES